MFRVYGGYVGYISQNFLMCTNFSTELALCHAGQHSREKLLCSVSRALIFRIRLPISTVSIFQLIPVRDVLRPPSLRGATEMPCTRGVQPNVLVLPNFIIRGSRLLPNRHLDSWGDSPRHVKIPHLPNIPRGSRYSIIKFLGFG